MQSLLLLVGNNCVINLFRDAVKSNVANSLLLLLANKYYYMLDTNIQEALERAITKSILAHNGISKPN